MEKIKLGDSLYKEDYDYKTQHTSISEHTVKKVGTKYLQCSRVVGRINKDTLVSDSGAVQMYRSKEDILLKKEKENIRQKIHLATTYLGLNKNITIEQLKEVAKILGV